MKNKKFDISDRKRTAFFIGSFFLGMASLVYLLPKTMFSIKNIVLLVFFLVVIDLIIIKLKTSIKHVQTLIGTCLMSVIVQLALFFWINYLAMGSHIEKYKIIGKTRFENYNLLILENNAYDDYFSIRIQNKYIENNDSITYYFSDGLLGINIVDSIK